MRNVQCEKKPTSPPLPPPAPPLTANAYLPKPFSPEELKAILIGLVSRNLASASSSAAATSSLDSFVTPPPPTSSVTLSPRESEVLKLLSLGLTNKEMSSNMFVSVRTVEVRIRSGIATSVSWEEEHKAQQAGALCIKSSLLLTISLAVAPSPCRGT